MADSVNATTDQKSQTDLRRGRRQDGEFMTSLMFDVSVERFTSVGFAADSHQPMAFRVDLRQLTEPLLKRIAVGLGAVTAAWRNHELILRPDQGRGSLTLWTWDQLGDEETPTAYLQRHFIQMNRPQVISLAIEPSYMQGIVAQRWAHRLGFPIPMPTVRRYLEDHGRMLYGVRHLEAGRFFEYLHVWGKRV